eukprot:1155229-Pelagomonas_calceolata.AAC.1
MSCGLVCLFVYTEQTVTAQGKHCTIDACQHKELPRFYHARLLYPALVIHEAMCSRRSFTRVAYQLNRGTYRGIGPDISFLKPSPQSALRMLWQGNLKCPHQNCKVKVKVHQSLLNSLLAHECSRNGNLQQIAKCIVGVSLQDGLLHASTEGDARNQEKLQKVANMIRRHKLDKFASRVVVMAESYLRETKSHV